jgi:phosphatidyl-myo-inositol alpha-mannosyltransferase
VPMPLAGSVLIEKAMPYLFPLALKRMPLDDFDIVHSHGDDHLIRSTRPLVRTFHGSSWAEARSATTLKRRLYHFTMRFFELLSERRATAIVTVSADTRQYLKRPAQVIPCTYDTTRFSPGGSRSERPSILFVGDLDTRKRGRLLVDVFSAVVLPALPDAELWVVTSDAVVADGVRSMGHVSRPHLAELYRRAWVFCLPSSYEGFGVPYIEAMACGTPVVATHNGGADLVLEGGQFGRLVADADLGATLVRLLTSPAERQQLACLGLERARAYDSQLVAAEHEALYERLLSRRTG